MDSSFRDPAESPRASHWPDMADEVDKPEDILREFLAQSMAHYSGNIPVTIAGLRMLVVDMAIQAIKNSAGDAGALEGLFGTMEPRLSDLEMCRRLITEIVKDGQPALQAECVDFVFAFGAGECRTQTEIAGKYGVGKACVSDRCVDLREQFNLPEVPGMKSDEAREHYSTRQMGKRQRPAKQTWGWAGFLKGALDGLT